MNMGASMGMPIPRLTAGPITQPVLRRFTPTRNDPDIPYMPSLSSLAARRTMRSRFSLAEPLPRAASSPLLSESVSNSMRLGSVALMIRLTLEGGDITESEEWIMLAVLRLTRYRGDERS